MKYSRTSSDGHPLGTTKVSVLERCPSYRGSEKHWHPTKSVKIIVYCGRGGSNEHENGLLEPKTYHVHYTSLLEQSKDLTVSCIL